MSSNSHSLSAEIIDRFRIGSLERIERLEALWTRLMADPNDTETVIAIDREVHTLKGEARMVGFTDVDMVAHKLEDVLELARERGFHINDDVDLVVTMALRFMAMLIRKKAGQTLGGIDLPGFVRQIDSVMRDARRQHPLRGRVSTSSALKVDPNKDLLSTTVRDRLAGVALDLFLELSSGRESRRVRRSWKTLRDSLAPPDPVAIAPILGKHEGAARDLANDLCKEVDLSFALDADARTSPAIVEALDVAMLHLIRNAIDHGVESVDQRAGKAFTATLTVRCTVDSDHVILEISDDGRGIDFESVRSRAVAPTSSIATMHRPKPCSASCCSIPACPRGRPRPRSPVVASAWTSCNRRSPPSGAPSPCVRGRGRARPGPSLSRRRCAASPCASSWCAAPTFRSPSRRSGRSAPPIPPTPRSIWSRSSDSVRRTPTR